MPDEERQRELLRIALLRANRELDVAIGDQKFLEAQDYAKQICEYAEWIANIDIPF